MVWEITTVCNPRCLHCCYSTSAKPHPDELSTAEAEDVLRQLADIGAIILGFSGGEPMLRRDWRPLVRLAVESGIIVSIGTSGSVVTERRAAELKDLGVSSVCVSLDGSTPAQVPLPRRRLEHLRRIRAVEGSLPVWGTSVDGKEDPARLLGWRRRMPDERDRRTDAW